MKLKIALLMLTVLGSAALASPAQQANDRGLFAGRLTDQVDVEFQEPPLPPQPPVTFSAAATPPSQMGGSRKFFYNTTLSDMDSSSIGAQQLARKYAQEKGESGREQIKSRLTDVLKEQFDARQKRHQDEIKQLEDQIKKLKDLIEKRQENRQEIIARRLDQMLREAQGLGW